ncbi:MAG TPA: HAMP domain-containing sensor histidine kinase [Streptosporangiaceae bacterium]
MAAKFLGSRTGDAAAPDSAGPGGGAEPTRPRRLTPGAWWRRRGLRARLTLAASAGLAVALAGAGLLLVYAVQLSLAHEVEQTARQGASAVATMVNANDLPSEVPFAGGTISVQVLGPQGNVVNASPQSDRYAPLLPPAQARALAARGQSVLLPGGPYDLPYSQVLVVAQSTNGGEIVIAAASYTQVSNSVTAATQAFVIGAPLFFLLLVTSIWLITGAALRPIEELRRGAQEITGTAIARSLPVPEARDEVASLAVTLNDMLGRLAAAQQRQRALVSDAAHELRSPIASIRTQLEVAVDHPEAVDWQQTAAGVLADTLRLAKLAEDLLALARLDEKAGRQPGGRRVDLAELGREVCGRYAEARVTVTPRPYGKCMVFGDTGGLDRMLVNLIDNAVRYARSEVRVAAVADGPWAVLTVTDDGPGIPAGDAERVFDRFTRLDDARSRDLADEAGAGLGLAIVRATATAHGGSAWLEDADPGLRALVRLPAAQGQQGGDGDGGEQQGQVGDAQVEQAHRRGR